MVNKFRKLHEEHDGKISDKWSLYLDEWERILTPYHNKSISLLEIGIQNGGSLEIWGKYFENANKIIGCDVEPKCYQLQYEDERIHIVVGDVNTDNVENEIVQQSSSFDVIIDDGSHTSSDIIKSFSRYFPYLKDGGIYIAEDLHCSYWEFFEGSLFNPSSSISFFKRLADIVNYEHWRNNKSRYFILDKFAKQLDISFDDLDLARIHSVEFINSLCIIRKSPPSYNILGSRLIVGEEEKVTTSWGKYNGTTIYDIVVNIPNDDDLDIFNLIDSVANLKQQIASGEEQISKLNNQTIEIINEHQSLIDSKESSIKSLKHEISDLLQQNSSLNTQVVELSSELSKNKSTAQNQHQTILEYEKKILNLQQSVDENHLMIDNLTKQIDLTENSASETNANLSYKTKENETLRRIICEKDTVISNFQSSNSWKFTAPLRNLKNLKNPLKIDNIVSAQGLNNFARNEYLGCTAYFTICSKNFLAHARVLYNSIKPHYPNSRFFVVLCDKIDNLFDPNQEPFEFIYLEDLGLPNLQDMARRYNITEFNTAVKPFSFSHLFTKYGFDSIAYLDPDLFFTDKMDELDQMLSEGVEAILTPHILEPAENVEVDDNKMLIFGIYNLGFLALKNTKDVKTFLSWWERRLEYQCVIQTDKGLFVDQKWADLLPAFVSNTKVLHHPGYNVAYWNLSQRKITQNDGKWFANNQPLRFVHFSGNKIDDIDVFSRHSSITIQSIGDLALLLNDYREKVYSEGHEFYRSLPYAYSWNGESGENLHTPKTYDRSNPNGNGSLSNSIIINNVESEIKSKKIHEILPVISKHYGGLLPAANKVISAFRKKGWRHVKTKLLELKKTEYINHLEKLDYSLPKDNLLGLTSSQTKEKEFSRKSPNKKGVLYIDWAIPKPDIDAGSFMTAQLLRIIESLDYEVTFIPAGLEYAEGYYEALVDDGIEVICYPKITSLDTWLVSHAKEFDICILSRGPVVWTYLELLKKEAPDLKLIFSTGDLHYLRELRHAELMGDKDLHEAALVTRNQELDLIRTCDATIILSKEELYKVREIVPTASLVTLPLIFDEISGVAKTFEEKKDILFIGSFPHVPNIDAVIYFAKEIFPLVQKLIPDIRFKVIGANPPKEIQELSKNQAIEICGFVKDLKPFFDDIRLTIAPLRFGAGIKGKIGTSFSYGVPCVATKIAAEGMGLTHGKNILIGETPEEFAEAIYQAYTSKRLWDELSANSHKFAIENYSTNNVRNLVKTLLATIHKGKRPIEFSFEISEWETFQKHTSYLKTEYEKRLEVEASLLPLDNSEAFYTDGYCGVCHQETEFATSFMYSFSKTLDGRDMPNWREHMQCKHCNFINRIRASIHALFSNFSLSTDSRIYLTEQVTSTFTWFQTRYKNTTGSEFLDTIKKGGEILNGIRHENIMDLSFNDSSFDFVLSFDVLEHIPFPEKAFAEIFRVLDNNGVFLFTVPFSSDSQKDIIRATFEEKTGEINHHLPPEFHGNPVDPENGALCFRYFGWEMLDNLRAVGFSKVRAITYWSKTQGYLGREQYIFVAEKIS